METTARNLDGALEIRFAGSLDTTYDPDQKTRLLTLLEGHEANLLIDLRDLKTIDSAGLGLLLSLRKRVRDRHGQMALLTRAGSRVEGALRLTQIDQILPVFYSHGDALKALKPC